MSDSDLDEKTKEKLFLFVINIKNKKIEGSFTITIQTIKLLIEIINDTNKDQKLFEKITAVGKFLSQHLPQVVVTSNTVRRVLRIIRDQYADLKKNVDDDNLLNEKLNEQEFEEFKGKVLLHFEEFKDELELSGDSISSLVKDKTYSNLTILTIGRSKLLEKCLIKAAKTVKFKVLIAEGAPERKGRLMATKLADANIDTTLIPDNAIFAVMPRINKVMLGTHMVLANGGLKATAGSQSVALAAKYYNVPVYVIFTQNKLCPEFYKEQRFNELISPEWCLPYSDGPLAHMAHVYCPLYDYVSPDLIDWLIDNTGEHSTGYVYKLLSDLYHPDDYNFDK